MSLPLQDPKSKNHLMQLYCESLTEYKRLSTREVKIGDLVLGRGHPIRV